MSSISASKMRISGLSGMDTDSMVQQMMKAENLKMDKLKKEQTLLTWKQEAYRDITSTLRTFQSTYFSFTNPATNFRSETMFKTTKVSVTQNGLDSTAVSVSSTSASKAVTHKLKVYALASNDVYNSKSIGGTVTGDAAFDPSKMQVGDKFDITIDGTTKSYQVSADDVGSTTKFTENVNQFIKDKFGMEYDVDPATGVKKPGTDRAKLVISLDAQSKLKFDGVAGHTFKIGENTAPTPSVTSGSLSNLDATKDYSFQIKGPGVTDGTQTITINHDDFGGDTSAANVVSLINQKLQDAGVNSADLKAVVAGDKFSLTSTSENKYTLTDGDGTTNTQGFLATTGLATSMTLTTHSTMSALGFNATTASNSAVLNKNIKDAFDTSAFAADGSLTFKINDHEFSFTGDKKVGELMNQINGAGIGVTMAYNNVTGKFSLSSNDIGLANKIDWGTANPGDNNLGKALGFDAPTSSATDAIFSIDGVQTSRTTNSFDIDGLKVTLNQTAVTASQTGDIVIKSDPNTEDITKSIKALVDTYNKILDTINTETSEKRAKKSTYSYYEPLTSDERSAMSDGDIKLWEDKAKQGILSNDSTLQNIAQQLRRAITEPVTLADGTKISMYSIGISSTSYIDGGKLTIDDAKLQKALTENPDGVAKLFNTESSIPYSDKKNRATRTAQNGVASRLNDILDDAVKATQDSDGYRGSLLMKAGMKGNGSETKNVIYSQLKDYDERISKLQDYLTNKEDYYYSIFSAMDSAVQKSNSQSNYLTQQLSHL